MRTRLSYLRVFADSHTADHAAIAWHGLSQACHHHAYELTPSRDEVGRLIELVATLKAMVLPVAAIAFHAQRSGGR